MDEKAREMDGQVNGAAQDSIKLQHQPNDGVQSEQEYEDKHEQDGEKDKQETTDQCQCQFQSPPPSQSQEHEQEPEPEQEQEQNAEQPAGGYDDTPIPYAPPGYTLKFTFHRATNLPMADINSLSSDPYVLAQINTSLPMRHKEDPLMQMRTPTVRRCTNPEWNFEWIVANVPASGFKLKARIYDEDPADHDDRLGNAHVQVDHLDENWPGIQNQPYKVLKRSGSKRAYVIRACAACMSKAKHLNGDIYISVELLGRTKTDNGGKVYTVGPCWWIRHYSPMLGRIANRKETSDDEEDNNQASEEPNANGKKKSKAEKYNFQANQMQFSGPVPPQLYHRYVEFRPFVKGMFTGKGIRGHLLSKALHHQHARVYNFDRKTVWSKFEQGPSEDMTRAFLELVHWDKGGRIFTYVLTLDALLRFTETGKEFGIDMLSKHTMHSDVSIYIAFSGEFFIRRLKHANRPPPPDPVESSSHIQSPEHEPNETHPPKDMEGGPPDEEPPRDPAHYELVIDNDSGTYRPNAKLLPVLKDFLARSLPGLHIQTLDCQADAEKMEKMKQEQRDKKKKEGDGIVYAQHSRSSSISSSDESDLDDIEARQSNGQDHLGQQLRHDVEMRSKGRMQHLKNQLGRGVSRASDEDEDDDDDDDDGHEVVTNGNSAV